MDIQAFWNAVLRQDAAAIRTYFHPDAWVDWICTGERFTLEEYIRANCEYPGDWNGTVEQTVYGENCITTVTHVFQNNAALSFHVASVMRLRDGKIASMAEVWGDDTPAPQWRQDMGIGQKIKGV